MHGRIGAVCLVAAILLLPAAGDAEERQAVEGENAGTEPAEQPAPASQRPAPAGSQKGKAPSIKSKTELEEVVVEAKKPLSSASSDEVRAQDYSVRPHDTMMEILKNIPGMVVAQHQGGGKAPQWLIRGFDADHGTDFAVFADGMPVNLVTNAHGQGYADINFIIPETVERFQLWKGPYFTQFGDFANAGALNFITKDEFRENFAFAEGGYWSGQRYVVGASPQLSWAKTLLAAQYYYNNGPFVNKDVPSGLLREVADCTEEQLAQQLHQLQSGQTPYETPTLPDLEYTFKHALTHEVAYGAVLQDKRRALHARIMQAMEQIYAQRLDEQVERLAHHALRGEQWDQAFSYLRQAGEKAFWRSAHQEAVAAFENALEALTHLQATRDGDEFAIDLRLALRHSLHQLGEQARIRELMGQAEVQARALADSRRLVIVLNYTVDALSNLGEPDQAEEYVREALALADTLNDPGLQIQARFFFAMQRLFRGCLSGGDRRVPIRPRAHRAGDDPGSCPRARRIACSASARTGITRSRGCF